MSQITRIMGAVRSYLKDQEELNRLKDFKYEYDESAVNAAVNMALREINFKYQPKTTYRLESCPEYMLILGVAVQLLTSEIILKSRNLITVNDGSSIINREGNIKDYKAVRDEIKKEFDIELYHWKIGLNIEAGFRA